MNIRTDADLAAILGVNSRRIGKWRTVGGPENKSLRLWRGWLARTGRGTIAARITDDQIAAQLAALGVNETPQTPITPPSILDLAANRQDCALPGTDPTNEDARASAIDWRNEKAREQALTARREREILESRLVTTDQVLALVTRIGTCLAGILRDDAVWHEIRPELDALPSDQLRRLRQRHDLGLAKLRDRASIELRDLITTLGPNPRP